MLVFRSGVSCPFLLVVLVYPDGPSEGKTLDISGGQN